MNYITKEEMELVEHISEKYENKFKAWTEENEDYLMKWYDTQDKMSYFETACKFALYCTKQFIEHVGIIVEVD